MQQPVENTKQSEQYYAKLNCNENLSNFPNNMKLTKVEDIVFESESEAESECE